MGFQNRKREERKPSRAGSFSAVPVLWLEGNVQIATTLTPARILDPLLWVVRIPGADLTRALSGLYFKAVRNEGIGFTPCLSLDVLIASFSSGDLARQRLPDSARDWFTSAASEVASKELATGENSGENRNRDQSPKHVAQLWVGNERRTGKVEPRSRADRPRNAPEPTSERDHSGNLPTLS